MEFNGLFILVDQLPEETDDNYYHRCWHVLYDQPQDQLGYFQSLSNSHVFINHNEFDMTYSLPHIKSILETKEFILKQ
jgi:hypothetical protein